MRPPPCSYPRGAHRRASVHPELGVLRIVLHGLVEIGLADGPIAERASEQPVDLLWHQTMCRREIVDRWRVLPFALADQAAGIIGAKCNCCRAAKCIDQNTCGRIGGA
jgi:hypothetical protein